MFIDGHAHAAGMYSTVESILQSSKNHAIEKVVLCTSPKNNIHLKEPPNFPMLNSPAGVFLLNRMLRMAYRNFKDYGDGNQYVLALSQQLPDRVIPFLWVNPLDPTHLDALERNLNDHPFKGIKLHQAWNAFSVNGKEFAQLAEVAQAKRLPIFIHLYSPAEAQKLSQFVRNHADVVFIIAHMLGVSIFAENCRNCSNLYFDTSGSERIRGRDIQEGIDLVGCDHVLFGTDTPYAKIEDQIRKIEQLALSDREKEQIFRLNITNLLSLNH